MGRAVARLPRWWTEGEYCGDFALLVAGRGVSWQFVPHSILPKPIIKEAKFRENRLHLPSAENPPKSSRESADFALFSRARLKFFLVSSPEL